MYNDGQEVSQHVRNIPMKIMHHELNTNKMSAETDLKERLRFEMELEFVQCLANPKYLHCKCPIPVPVVFPFIALSFAETNQTLPNG